MRIREIVLSQKLSTIPGASPILEGVFSLRGAVIPVINMRKFFAMPEADKCTTSYLLIVSLAHQSLALEVDAVMDVIMVQAREIMPLSDMSDDIRVEHLLGICQSDDRVFMILDIDSLLGDSERRHWNDTIHPKPGCTVRERP